jgi:hypothetical protein
MKTALTILSTLTLLGCSGENLSRLPTTPDTPDTPEPPPYQPVSAAWLWGMVVEDSGVCIVGATVTVVRGQGLGQSIKQTTPCDAWAYDGGFLFRNLAPGVEMTLRTSATGYAAVERTVVPSSGPQMALLLVPSRTP